MVRTTIACAPCRKSKVKCMHEGFAPCRNCLKKGPGLAAGCVLAGPELKSRSRHRDPGLLRPRRSNADVPIPSPLGSSGNSPVHLNGETRVQPEGEVLLDAIEVSTVLLACSTFARKFPELRFLHWPTFSRRVREAWGTSRAPGRAKLRQLCAAILALCAPLLTCSVPVDRIVGYIRENISVVDFPDITAVQTLVVLSMHEWGAGNGYLAWMYSGIATRMMQSLLVLTKLPSLPEAEQESYNRTLWSCFVMDRLVFCGRAQPFALSINSLNTHWPVGEQDFALGQVSRGEVRDTGGEQGPLEYMEGDMDHYFGVLVRGFDIWARILKFVVSGGRRQNGMCLPENHPWVDGSAWRLLYGELQMWRQCKDRRLRYPEMAVDGHVALGQGEQFGYINLVYYVSILFLHREYIPFLPDPELGPSGPIDPPLLPLQAPSGWWAERSEELFAASANTVKLLDELQVADAELLSPFAGFCSFSAATMNLYVLSFPRINLGRSTDMPHIVSTNLEYLNKFRKALPMGEGWWVTIQHCRELYEHASRDRQMFQGRTRADFAALEYSIHDSRGEPPTHEEEVTPVAGGDPRAGGLEPGVDSSAEGGSTMIDTADMHQDGGELIEHQIQLTHDSSQVWPLWGQHQNIPFAVEGVPFDYNLDVLNTMYP